MIEAGQCLLAAFMEELPSYGRGIIPYYENRPSPDSTPADLGINSPFGSWGNSFEKVPYQSRFLTTARRLPMPVYACLRRYGSRRVQIQWAPHLRSAYVARALDLEPGLMSLTYIIWLYWEL